MEDRDAFIPGLDHTIKHTPDIDVGFSATTDEMKSIHLPLLNHSLLST